MSIIVLIHTRLHDWREQGTSHGHKHNIVTVVIISLVLLRLRRPEENSAVLDLYR